MKLFVLLWLLLSALSAAGFTSEGHIRIEERACTILLERAQAAQAAGSPLAIYRRGTTIIPQLYHLPVLWDVCRTGLPGARTAFPDHSGERQFAQDLQPYHFMAANKYVVRAARENKDHELTDARRQQLLLRGALPRCLALMYFLYREIVTAGLTATSESGRGAFVLLHIVADSYSGEQAIRTADSLRLVTVNGWQLSRLGWPDLATNRTTKCDPLPMLHRTSHALGDEEWRGCVHGLSPRAEAAAQACADLLEAIARASQPGMRLDPEWQRFAIAHFRPANCTVTSGWFVRNPTSDNIRLDLEGQAENAFNFD